jgi:hypothetical protein
MCCNDKTSGDTVQEHREEEQQLRSAPSEKRPSNRCCCCWSGGRVRTSPLLYSLGLRLWVEIVGVFSFGDFRFQKKFDLIRFFSGVFLCLGSLE